MAASKFKVEVEALDPTEGYLIRGRIVVDGEIINDISEHRATELEVRTRLGTGFDAWAALVDSE